MDSLEFHSKEWHIGIGIGHECKCLPIGQEDWNWT